MAAEKFEQNEYLVEIGQHIDGVTKELWNKIKMTNDNLNKMTNDNLNKLLDIDSIDCPDAEICSEINNGI